MESLQLVTLKQDLQKTNTQGDDYLITLLGAARGMIAREGITLEDTEEDNVLVAMYAAWLFRKRQATEGKMPRMLRAGLNNRLFSEKAGGKNVV